MRKVFSVGLMAAMLCLVGMTKDAGATITIALEWGACGGGTGGCTATGGSSITVNPGGGQTLRLDIFLSTNQLGGIGAHGFSLNFDTDLLNELNAGAMGAVEWGGFDVDPRMGFVELYGPISSGNIPATPESTTGGVSGRFNLIESGALGSLALPENGLVYTIGTVTTTAPARYRIAQVFFSANGAISDGADVFSGVFSQPPDGFIDSTYLGDITGTVLFSTASLNVVPEPGTVSLLGLGLVGLVLAGRRSRRS